MRDHPRRHRDVGIGTSDRAGGSRGSRAVYLDFVLFRSLEGDAPLPETTGTGDGETGAKKQKNGMHIRV
ncbi:hypothetical protein ZHAS_00013867 [Anopheles sinensis]|uniref:Uncharacterized protein n=1 Tax=Anopheles sinensis TaxID=74873 RepID=A0A084W6Q9_ANOSI|nr:hypothetical protein ZHAS_00013867 [Anopheles sinensis]